MADLLGLRTTGKIDDKAATSVSAASETVSGIAELATQAETNAGTDDLRIVTPLKLANYPPILLDVLNTTGSTLVAGMMMYTTYVAGSGIEIEYAASASTLYSASAAVVVNGGADGTRVKVATRGRYNLTYTGTAPSQGDYLIFGTSGAVVRQTFMSPDVIAIAMAGGAGSVVDALLLTQTQVIGVTSANPVMSLPALSSDSDFNGTIATLPGGAGLTYNVTSGDEKWMDAFSTTALGKLVLHNTTRGTEALISDTNVATNTLTLTANVPAGWATTDVITVRSQTNTDTSGGAYFLDYEITDTIDPLARWIDMDFSWFDTGAVGQRTWVHPYEAYSDSKAQFLDTQVLSRIMARTASGVPLIKRRFTLRANASGSNTCAVNLYVLKQGIAVP